MFFNSWETIERTIIVGILAYIGLIFFVRISGKRTLSKMNAFDLVVTVALGSTLATILLSKKVALAEGFTAFLLLIGMQYLIAWLSVRSTFVSQIIKSTPKLLYYKGEYFKYTMKKERVLEVEILQAVRSNGTSSMSQVEAVVLETDGSISVIKKSNHTEYSTLRNVSNKEG
nr:YetF domain-containing protein [Domibacillus robiginosus]